MILGIYGFQDSGKTNTVEKLVSALSRKGYKVASVKHSPHKKSVDCEGKDTWRHWKAGSDPVAFSSDVETAVIRHSKMSADAIAGMIEREFNPDVIIFEGFKEGVFPKVAIGDIEPRTGTVLVNPKLERLVAFVEREVAVERALAQLAGLDCGKCGLDCRSLAEAIVDGKRKVRDCAELSDIKVEIRVDGKRVAAGRFVSSLVDGTVRGMIGTLKGAEPGGAVEIRLQSMKGVPKKRRKR